MTDSAHNGAESDGRPLTAEREQRILELLRQATALSVPRLARELGVSEATVRRDLHGLHAKQLLRRVHGGATLHQPTRVEPLFEDKESSHSDAKRRIADRALALIADHDILYLDGGSTCLMLARRLEARRDLTVVTNSLMAAAALMASAHRLILAGGEFRALSRTLVGPLTASVIGSLHIDKAFMGTIGFTLADGMTTTDPGEAFTKEQVMRRAGQVILLADHSKLGVPSFARSGAVEDVDVLVTDAIEPRLRRALKQRGVDVIVA
jgi:DeoR/GlpR family transcriptional regulator of sugar metabolism